MQKRTQEARPTRLRHRHLSVQCLAECLQPTETPEMEPGIMGVRRPSRRLPPASRCDQEPKVPPGTHRGQPHLPFPMCLSTEKGLFRCVAATHSRTFESLAPRLRPVGAGSLQRLAHLVLSHPGMQNKLVTVTLVLVWPLSLEFLHDGVYCDATSPKRALTKTRGEGWPWGPSGRAGLLKLAGVGGDMYSA